MKIGIKTTATIGLLFLMGISYGQKKKKNAFELTFEITNVKNSEVYIAHYYAGKTYIDDTLYPLSAKSPHTFVWKKDTMPPRGVYILAGENKAKYMDFFIDSSRYFTIFFDYDRYNKGDTGYMKAENSPENTVAFDFMLQMALFDKNGREIMTQIKHEQDSTKYPSQIVIDSLRKEMSIIRDSVAAYMENFLAHNSHTLFGKLQKLMQDVPVPLAPEGADSNWRYQYYINHYWDNCDFTDEALIYSPVFTTILENYYDEKKALIPIVDTIIRYTEMLIEKTTAANNRELFKYIVWFVTHKYEISQYIGQDAIFVHMVKNYYEKGRCPWVDPAVLERMVERADILDKILLGKKAPELIMPDSNNAWHSLYEFNTKYTILWFWNLDCGHCKTATPKLIELYNRAHKELDFEVFAVCEGSDTTRWKKAIIEKGLPWLNVGRNTANLNYHTVYDVTTTPSLYVLDKEKRIICKKIDVDHLEEFLRNDMAGKKMY
ncbi:MAG: DUF5106 domain-containing protein [Bacteroidales bacterium]|jgi:thiol-disulfide isomerase/thioredoxin|nr:DUF5106 domain-containing protein [Bacteroidales bacterium]